MKLHLHLRNLCCIAIAAVLTISSAFQLRAAEAEKITAAQAKEKIDDTAFFLIYRQTPDSGISGKKRCHQFFPEIPESGVWRYIRLSRQRAGRCSQGKTGGVTEISGTTVDRKR